MNVQGLNEIEGLQFVPVDKDKRPTKVGWQTIVTKYDLSNVEGVGLVCGIPSGNVEALDFDCKYDLTGTLFDRYKKAVNALDRSLLAKMSVQETRSGGYHMIYRCSKIEGNKKLANRHTTEAEKEFTYKKTYDAEVVKGDDAKAKKIADKAKADDKVRVLIETRGIGGQIVVEPSPGYKFIWADLISIQEITVEERDTLHTVARQFNEIVSEYVIPTRSKVKQKGLTPFDDYNQRGDIIELLISHGWETVERASRGSKTQFRRPGQTSAVTSGNFDHDKNWFSVFTTSTQFEAEKAYLPCYVYATLECDGDFSAAAKKLYDEGFGDRNEVAKKAEAQSTRQIKSRIEVAPDSDKSYLATRDDYKSYLQQVRDGTLPQGLTTGSRELDKYFLFKLGNLVSTNGIDNTGKSVFMWWLMMIAAMYHGWVGIIFSSENSLGAFMRKMIQFYWGKPLHGPGAMNDIEYDVALKFVEKHFRLIKAQEELYNYKDIINIVKNTLATEKCDYGMIDPYNSLKIDLSGFSKLSTHDYHYEAYSEIKAFGQKNNFGWFINHHAVTAATRAKDGEKKYPVAPGKADTEGGAKVANKTDDFLTIHRITQHPQEWMITQVHVRKIKETDTGGRVTPLEEPVKFEMYKSMTAFREYVDGFGHALDPIEEWHKKNGTYVQAAFTVEANGGGTWKEVPYEKTKPDDDDMPF